MRFMMKLLAVLFVFALLAAACGDDDEGATDVGSDSTVTDDGSTDDGSTDDGSTDDGSTDDGSTDDDGSAVDDGVCTEDRKGGELRLTSRGISAALDTAISTLSSAQTGSEGLPFYSVLARLDMDTQQYVPHVAEAVESNDDGSEWTITLRDGVLFGNGDPLDADALVAHFDRHLGPDSTSRVKRGAIFVIASWEKVDDMNVKVTLNFPYAQFPSLISADLGMVQNVALINERGEDFATNAQGAGVGPYELVEYKAPERIVFEAKDDWWGGPVCIQTLTYTFIPTIEANYDAFVQDEIDTMLIARDPATIVEAQSEYETLSQMFNTAYMLMPNARGGPTADVRVRQAMAYAIDPEVVNQRAWTGVGWGAKGLIHPESVTVEATDGLAYDEAKAKELLKEYMDETGWDGKISGIAADTPQANQEAALAVAAMLDAVGFEVETTLLPINDLIGQVYFQRDFEVVLSWGIINSEFDLYPGLRQWETTNPANPSGFASEAYDAALVLLREATNLEEYQAALEATQLAVNEDVPFVSYGGDLSTMLFDPKVKGGISYQNQVYLLDQAYLEE